MNQLQNTNFNESLQCLECASGPGVGGSNPLSPTNYFNLSTLRRLRRPPDVSVSNVGNFVDHQILRTGKPDETQEIVTVKHPLTHRLVTIHTTTCLASRARTAPKIVPTLGTRISRTTRLETLRKLFLLAGLGFLLSRSAIQLRRTA